jgi:hypothetical protein
VKYLDSKASTVGIFFAAATLLILYLLSIRWHIHLSVALFWLAIVLMLGAIVYQSLKFKLSSGYAKVVLLEIAVTCLVFQLIYQIPFYGLRGTDTFLDMASAKGILSSGFIMGGPEYINVTSPWPMIHILGTDLSLITGIGLFAVVKWFPSFLGVALILLLYLLVRRIFKNEKVALLSALLFACLQNHILFGSLFIRETIALVLMMGCLYLYFSARSSTHPAAYYALSIMCFVGTILAHHFTSLMLFLFLLIHFLVTRAAGLSALKKRYFGGGIAGEKVGVVFLVLTLVFPVAYSMSGGIQPPAGITPGGGASATLPVGEMGSFLGILFKPGEWGPSYADIAGINVGSIQAIRGYIIFFGFWLFIAIFAAILLYRLLPRVRNSRLETYSFILFLFLCGLCAFLGLYYIPIPISPDRFLTFGFLFGFTPLVIAVLDFNRIWLRRIGMGVLIAFMLFNIYWIEPTAWSGTAEGVPAASSEQDYALANTFNFPNNATIVAHANVMMAIYDMHNNWGTPTYGWASVNNLSRFDWVIVQKQALRLEQKYHPGQETETMAEIERLMREGSPDRDMIYESNALAAFKLRKGIAYG